MKQPARLPMLTIAVAFALAAAPAVPAAAQNMAAPRPGDAPRQDVVPPGPLPPVKGDRIDRDPTETASSAERKAARIDVLFGRLATSKNDRQAKRIARHIMRRLAQSGSATADLLMTQAALSMKAKDYGKALDILDGVVRLHPTFVEGWNRRATVHFLAGDYGQSLSDIEQVLRREPRHWGALSGMAMILLELDREAEAKAVMDRALEVHPHLEDMRKRRDRIALELSGAEI